jgi:predicted NAD/FAD-dependent oxidoreductase
LTVLKMLESVGLVAPWKGNFGLLGSQGGGFLPSAIVGEATASGMKKKSGAEGEEKDESVPSPNIDTGDFCGFVSNHNEKSTTFVAVPDNASLCPEICRLASIDVRTNTTVLQANMLKEGGWQLNVVGKELPMEFDALVLASHDPTLAAQTVEQIATAEAQTSLEMVDESNKLLQNRLTNLVTDLKYVRGFRQPVFTWSGRFPYNSLNQTFDAVSVPGSHLVQFLALESSKPGRSKDENIWTAVSTSALARDLLKRHGPTRNASQEAATILSKEVSKLLKVQETTEVPSAAVRWGSAFTSKTMNLKEDSIFLSPWRLAIAGDFVRDIHHHPTPMEASALSGLEAGERVAAMFGAPEQ